MIRGFGSPLRVGRQDLQVSRLIWLPKLSEQAREVERLPTERDNPVSARPLVREAIPGQPDPIEI